MITAVIAGINIVLLTHSCILIFHIPLIINIGFVGDN